MGAFSPLLPTGLDQDLVPLEVRSKYYEEILFTTDFTPFMGEQPTAAIQVGYKKMGSGDTLNVPFKKEIDYKNPIKGNFAQISGKGQLIEFYSDGVTVELQAIPDVLPGVQFMNLDSPVAVFDAMKPTLQIAHKRNIVYSLLKSATIDAYPDFDVGPVADRVIYSGVNYNANIQTALDSMNTGSAYNQNGLSVALIRKMRDYAIYGGTSFEHEKRISPIYMATEKGAWVPTYVYLMDTPSYRSLCQDPDWKGYFTRGTIESTVNQPSGLKGAFFKGLIDNVEIYECPELGNFQQQTTNGAHKFSWNLFLGAQAFYLLWGEMPWFSPEWSNHRTIVEMAMLEIRGQKSLKYPSFNNPGVTVENGIIHSFVNITGL
jgi:hypothetical protein